MGPNQASALGPSQASAASWYAVGFHDQPGWPIPKHNKRHIDRWCGYLADKPDEDIRELSEEEIAEHERCLGCAG